jgi:hypothetical protein
MAAMGCDCREYPDSCEFISTKQLGHANRVAPIVLDVVARLARNQ